MNKIKKGQGEYKKCQRCGKRFRRKKSIWNLWIDSSSYLFCPECQKSFNRWLKNQNENQN